MTAPGVMFWYELRRRWLLRKAPEGALRDYLATPFQRGGARSSEARFLAVDLEMTGLDPERDHIVSIGWVPLDHNGIRLAGARQVLVRPKREMAAESAVIHKITDQAAAAGLALEDALPTLLEALRGRVMIAHHARIEIQFLARACQRIYGCGIVIPTVDTEWLARRRLERRDQAYRPQELGLESVRARYNLPLHRAHDALHDAIATAELFLAQLSEYGAGKRVALSEVLFPA